MKLITKWVNVTPTIAKEWLTLNPLNRKFRRTHCNTLKARYLRGEYQLSHQGIAFSVSGMLIDGQHRLTAISELDSGVFPMMVTWGFPDSVYEVIDLNLKRTIADSLRMDDARPSHLARLIVFILDTKVKASISAAMTRPLVEVLQPVLEDLFEAYPGNVKTWSTAPVQLAAVCQILKGEDPEYVKSIYKALATCDYASMPPIALAVSKLSAKGQISSSDPQDLLTRMLPVFSQEKKDLLRLKSIDLEATRQTLWSLFGHLLEGQMPGDNKAIATGRAIPPKLVPFFSIDEFTPIIFETQEAAHGAY